MAAAAACSGVLACERGPGRPTLAEARARTLVAAATAEPRSLLPLYAVDLVEGQLCDLLYQRLAVPTSGFSTVGDRDYRPALATAWTWGPDSQSVRFTLDTSARWHDGRRVTSRDVRFTFDLLRDSAALLPRARIPDVVDSVTTPDPHTAVVWARRRSPTLFHGLTYAAHVLPAHQLEAIPRAALATHMRNRHPVGSGPFRLARWVAGSHLELDRVGPTSRLPGGPDGGAPAARVVLRVLPGYEAARTALLAGDVDVFAALRPQDVPAVARVPRLATLRLSGFSYAMLQFNLRARPVTSDGVRGVRGRRAVPHPVFGDVRVRRALAMSVDRRGMVGNLLADGGAVSVGPTTRALGTADTSAPDLPYDPSAAGRLLDAAGWRAADGGVRWRAGRRLAFSILVPASSGTRAAAAVLLQQMFARIGAAVDVRRTDHASMVNDLERGDFDAALNALSVDPDPADVRNAWGTRAARTGAGFNYGGYASARTDALLDSAAGSWDARTARAWYRQAYRAIVEDAPAIFLYEPIGLVAYDARWRPAGVRADAWWAGLAEWRRVP